MLEQLYSLDITPFVLSFKLAALTTAILFVFTLPLAWYLSQSRSKIKPLIEAIVSLPIVLPPSVLGFYFVVLFAHSSALGKFFSDYLGIELLFSFTGLVIASVIYSLPFMIQPLQNGFESLNKEMIESSYIAGKGVGETLIKVALPNMKPSIITAIIITFAHTVGEFGVVLMVGGSIPDETKVASVAIYELVEVMEYESAHIYSAILLILSFGVLLGVYMFNYYQKNRHFR